ncbi:Asp-tRNA(Asn)/Glu-tRNA(Gln) amidotransferase A subunit family amidase [Variovorax sp. W2I14]
MIPPLGAHHSLDAYSCCAQQVTHAPLDATASGHEPALQPFGVLPVVMMWVGRHFDDATVLAAAFAFEQAGFASLD